MRKILRMVITDIVINTLLGRVTRHPAGMHCPARDDAFVSSFCFFVCHAPSPERRVFEGCIVRTRISLPFIGRFRDFDAVCSVFFRKGLHFQTSYIVLTSVARWRHNSREIAVRNCENPKIRRKSLCAPLRIDS